MEDRIAVLVVAPSPVVRRGLAQTADAAPRLEVVASVGSVRAALAVLRGRHTDVAVLDDALRVAAGVDPVRLLQRSFPELGIVLVAADPGAIGDGTPVPVVSLDADTDDLAEVVLAAAAQDGRAFSAVPPARPPVPVGDPVLDGLKPIERRVLELLADGLSNREIATLVHLSERMVKKYLSSVFAALGVARRTEAAVVYTTRRTAAGAAAVGGRRPSSAAGAVASTPDIAELAADLEEKRVIAEELQQQLAVVEDELDGLQEELGRYRVVYDDMPVPHLLTDAYGVVRAADRAMASLLGLAVEDLRGKTLASLVPDDGRRQFRQRLAQLARGEVAPAGGDAARTFVLGDHAHPVRVVATVGGGDRDRYLHWTVAGAPPGQDLPAGGPG